MKPAVSRLGLAGAFLLQAALLSSLVLDRALLLARGTEIRLSVRPVDPRDLFRGDYVVLAYALSQVRTDETAGEDRFATGEPIYVSLQNVGGTWTPVGLHRAPLEDSLSIKGTVTGAQDGDGCRTPCRIYDVDYGLEQFFVPEGEGRALENLRNDERLEVDVAVGADGRAALRRLLVDGVVRYEDSLF
jgi:uncharacterized membrane-anchored protein